MSCSAAKLKCCVYYLWQYSNTCIFSFYFVYPSLTALYIMFFVYSIFYITSFYSVLIFDGCCLNYWCFIWAYNFSFLTENFILSSSLAFVCTVTHIVIYCDLNTSTLTLSLKSIMHVYVSKYFTLCEYQICVVVKERNCICATLY